jgi:hypothetical protein
VIKTAISERPSEGWERMYVVSTTIVPYRDAPRAAACAVRACLVTRAVRWGKR